MKRKSRTAKKIKTAKPRDKKEKPLSEKINKSAVRHLVHNGAFFGQSLTDDQFIKILEKGELGKDFRIKRRGMISNPVIVGTVKFEGSDIEIELEIGGNISSKPAHVTLQEAGAPEEIVEKVMKIEFALRRGAHEVVDEILEIKDEFNGFMGSIEGAIARSGKKEK